MVKVSVIIPIYNVEPYIHQCLDSVLNQTLKDIEIILVDDESPDNCPQICEDYAKQDRRIKVIHKKNDGLGFARNSGLEIAVGEYVSFVDSDDLIETSTYEYLYNLTEKEKPDVIFFGEDRFTNRPNPFILSTDAIKYFLTEADVHHYLCGIIAASPNEKYTPYGCAVWKGLYRREVITNKCLRFHSERELMSEDLVFNIDFLTQTSKIILTTQKFYHYRNNPTSLTNTLRIDRYIKYRNMYDYFQDTYSQYYLQLFFDRWLITKCCSYLTKLSISCISKEKKFEVFKQAFDDSIWNIIQKRYPTHKLPIHQRLFLHAIKNKKAKELYLIAKAKIIYRKFKQVI